MKTIMTTMAMRPTTLGLRSVTAFIWSPPPPTRRPR